MSYLAIPVRYSIACENEFVNRENPIKTYENCCENYDLFAFSNNGVRKNPARIEIFGELGYSE